MSIIAATPKSSKSSLRWAISDVLTIARRNLLALVRIPTSLVFAVIQPVMFVLLFRFIFGNVIQVPGGVYVNFLIPGILVQNIGVVIIITFVGMAVDFRPSGSFVSYIQACLLMLVFAYCLSWGFAFVGLAAPNSETAQAMAFPVIFPLTFASSIFVPVAKLPGWLQPFAINQPVSQCADAVRGLMLGTPHGASTWITLAWAIGAIAVLAPLATAQYRKVA